MKFNAEAGRCRSHGEKREKERERNSRCCSNSRRDGDEVNGSGDAKAAIRARRKERMKKAKQKEEMNWRTRRRRLSSEILYEFCAMCAIRRRAWVLSVCWTSRGSLHSLSRPRRVFRNAVNNEKSTLAACTHVRARHRRIVRLHIYKSRLRASPRKHNSWTSTKKDPFCVHWITNGFCILYLYRYYTDRKTETRVGFYFGHDIYTGYLSVPRVQHVHM